MSDERDETRSFSPFDDSTWADDADRPGLGRSDGRRRRQSRTPDDRTRPQPRTPEDDPSPPPGGPDDATRLQAPGEQPLAPDDATRLEPRTDADRTLPQPGAAGDSTVVGGPVGRRPVDATSVLPPADDDSAWSGRAEVRAPQPAQTIYQEEVDWPSGPEPQQRDRWWLPIVVGIVVLVLLAALGWGIYLIVQNAGKSGNTPGPAVNTSAPPAPSTAATTQSAEPSSAPTTPTPTVSTTEPTDDAVAIPALRGLTVADAKAALTANGFSSTRVIYRPSSAQQDTVIDSDPEEGQEVPPDTTVTLVVAAPSTTTATGTATTTGTTGN
jgi:PASTA domain